MRLNSGWPQKLLSIAGSLFLTIQSSACESEGTSQSDCPSYVVTPDAGISGFSSVGEWRTDSVCTQFCGSDYPVCQLATPTSVKCQKGCG